MVDVLVAHLEVLGLDKVKESCPANSGRTITTRYHRGIRKAAKAAGISWLRLR